MTWLTGWRLSLRLARRDALRSRGRSILVLLMIALPVLAVTAADVVIQTQDVSSAESLDRRLGAADARVNVQEGVGRVYQGPDPDEVSSSEVGGKDVLTADEVSDALGGARLVEERIGSASIVSTKGVADVEVTEVDLSDPVTRGLFDLTSGRWPAAKNEVVVNEALTRQGLRGGRRPRDAEDRCARPDHRGDRGVDDCAQLPHRRGAGRQPGRRDVRRSNLARRRRPGQLGEGAGAQPRRSDGAVACGRPRPAADPARGGAVPRPGRRRDARSDRAGRGDGADRGGPARRPGVRGRRPPTVQEPRPDGGHRRHSRAGSPGRHGRRGRAGRYGVGDRRRRRYRHRMGAGADPPALLRELVRPVRRAVAAPASASRRSDCSARSSPPRSRR